MADRRYAAKLVQAPLSGPAASLTTLVLFSYRNESAANRAYRRRSRRFARGKAGRCCLTVVTVKRSVLAWQPLVLEVLGAANPPFFCHRPRTGGLPCRRGRGPPF